MVIGKRLTVLLPGGNSPKLFFNRLNNYDINWNIPNNIGFFISSNESGYSSGKFKHANFSYSVGDDRQAVKSNIESIKEMHNIKYISFMKQSHSNKVNEIIKYTIIRFYFTYLPF